jgi:polysaccharide deacetylase 2 family uncharacterized protein YibQ
MAITHNKNPLNLKNSVVKLPFFIFFLYCWAMPANSMPDTDSVTPVINTLISPQITILNNDLLSNIHDKAPTNSTNLDSIINNTTTLDENNEDIEHQIIVAEVAIIIDDIGYNRSQGLAAINIPGKLTYAIIPHSPHAKSLAIAANKMQKELILHAPITNIHNYPMGQSGLSEEMSEENFHNTLSNAIASVPYVIGVNNHMGSLLTQQQRPMEWTMKTLKAHGLYFIDSRTTPASIAWKTAQQFNIASLKRDVFLDHERDSGFIAEQFERFISIAKRKGYAIAIAHPYPETIKYLRDNINRLKAHGIRLRTASELVNYHSPNKQQAKM